MMEVHGDDAQNIADGPDATHPGDSRVETGLARRIGRWLARWFTLLWPVIVTLIIIGTAFFIDVVVSHGRKGAALVKGTQPDASVFISTLILLYTVFIAVYGALLP
jgi:hypothetical protein